VGQLELAERLYKEVLHADPWHKRALVAYALMLQEKLAQVGRLLGRSHRAAFLIVC
jgi:hypothetical protein